MQLPSIKQQENLVRLAVEHGCTIEIECNGSRLVISPNGSQTSVVSLDANRARRK